MIDALFYLLVGETVKNFHSDVIMITKLTIPTEKYCKENTAKTVVFL